jgi:phospholipid/cholesterol/gamma-HCH transport system ATP-binding protein
MDPSAPVLDLAAARPQVGADEAPALEIDLRLMAGELALVDARHSARPTWLADLCCGLVPLAAGTARVLGRDWSAVPPDYADALRGRIGRVFFSGSWIGFIDVSANILLPQLHHTRDDPNELRDRATALLLRFWFAGFAPGAPR